MIRRNIAAAARCRLIVLLWWLGAMHEGGLLAQNIVRWTTNYYTVTGATVREIRRSMNAARPWRNREGVDASTTWKVEWKYALDSSGGCAVSDVSTVTTIATTLPRYIPPTNVATEVVQQWVKYFSALAKHEAVHAGIGTSAATEIQAHLASHAAMSDCVSLRRSLDAAANGILNRRRRDERDLDVRTQHGATEGARFP